MTISRIPSLALLLVGSVLALVPSLHAGASNKNGNPFGNGTFFPNTGTFSAIVRGNYGLIGAVEFSTSKSNTSTSSLTNSGVATIYANGQQYVGSAFGVINGSTIAATYFGSNSIISSTNTCSGQFSATLQNSYPNQIFYGTGEGSISAGNNIQPISSAPIWVSGSRLQ